MNWSDRLNSGVLFLQTEIGEITFMPIFPFHPNRKECCCVCKEGAILKMKWLCVLAMEILKNHITQVQATQNSEECMGTVL